MQNNNEIKNEVAMLQGNINRMCVTIDEKELEYMRYWAKIRIDKIFSYRQNIILDK